MLSTYESVRAEVESYVSLERGTRALVKCVEIWEGGSTFSFLSREYAEEIYKRLGRRYVKAPNTYKS